MLCEELQRLVISRGQLPEQILDLEQHSVEVHADLGRRHGAGAEPHRLQLLHDDALALLGQTDEVVVVAEQDEGLWKLENVEKQS